MAPKLPDVFTNGGGAFYPLLKKKMVNATPFGNPYAYCLKGGNRNLRKFGSGIFLKVPQLYDVLPKEEFYPLMKTHLVNAEPYEYSNAGRLEAPNRQCLKVGAAISLRAPKLYDVFPKDE